MTHFRQFLNREIGRGPIDSALTRLGLWGGGFFAFCLAAMALRSAAHNRAEFVLGVEAALVMLLLMILLGVLGGRFHDAASMGDLRTRTGAYLSYPASLAILFLGGWQIAVLTVDGAGMILGSLLLVAACMAIFCLGVAVDLVRSARI